MILAIVGLAVTVLWILAGIWYVGAFIGFDTLMFLMPNELGQVFIGFFAPLAFLWLVLAYLHFGQRMRRLEDSIWEIAAVRLPRVEAGAAPQRTEQQRASDAPPLPPPWPESQSYAPPPQLSPRPASPSPGSQAAAPRQPSPQPAAPQPAPAAMPSAETPPPWWRQQAAESAPPPRRRIGSASEVYESRMRCHEAGTGAPPAADMPPLSSYWPAEPPREARPDPAPRQCFDDRRYVVTWSSFEGATPVERDWWRESASGLATESSPSALPPRRSPPVEEPRATAPRGYMLRRSEPPQRSASDAAPPASPPAAVDESMVVQPFDAFAPPPAVPRFRTDAPRPASLRPEPPRPDPPRPDPLRPDPLRPNPLRPNPARAAPPRPLPAKRERVQDLAPRPAPANEARPRGIEAPADEAPRRGKGNGSQSLPVRPVKAAVPPSAPEVAPPPPGPRPSGPGARSKAKTSAKTAEAAESSVADRPIGFRHLVRITSMELNSIAMDLSAALSRDAEHAQALKGYDKGEKDVFFDLLCSKMSEQPPIHVVEHLRDLGAEHLLGNYAHKFQSLIAESKKVDRSGALGRSLETMPIGRLNTRIEAVQATASPR